jgi:hypothetical protein
MRKKMDNIAELAEAEGKSLERNASRAEKTPQYSP